MTEPIVTLFPSLTAKQKALLIGKETTGYWREVAERLRRESIHATAHT